MTSEYRAWLVDLDGTLYRPLPLKLMMAAQLVLTGWSQIGLLRRFREEHEALREQLSEPVDSPFDLQVERTAAGLGLEPQQVETVVRDWMVTRPGRWVRLFRRRALLAEIEAFKQAGGQTALVSDYPARPKLEALGAKELFDVVVANGESGGPARLKPWPDGYVSAAERLGVPAENCLVIGDRDDADGGAARFAGMGFRKIG